MKANNNNLVLKFKNCPPHEELYLPDGEIWCQRCGALGVQCGDDIPSVEWDVPQSEALLKEISSLLMWDSKQITPFVF